MGYCTNSFLGGPRPAITDYELQPCEADGVNGDEPGLLAAIATSLDPDGFAYIRLLFPDATGVQVLPSGGVQDYDEAVKIVRAAYPDVQIVDPYELGQEVERRQPSIEVAQEYFEVEF